MVRSLVGLKKQYLPSPLGKPVGAKRKARLSGKKNRITKARKRPLEHRVLPVSCFRDEKSSQGRKFKFTLMQAAGFVTWKKRKRNLLPLHRPAGDEFF
jgi:hypothetical protein